VENIRRYTKIYFGENQISPGLIGLSPLPTAHPGSFQPAAVRASTTFYRSFTLAMGRSPGFGSKAGNLTPYSDSLSLRLHLNGLTLLPNLTRGLIMQKVRSHPLPAEAGHRASTVCRQTVSGLFHSPPGVLFTFPSRYWFTIGRQVVFSLGGWSPQIPTGFLVSGSTRDTSRAVQGFAYGAITRYGGTFQSLQLPIQVPCRGPTTPPGITSRRFRLFPFRSPLLRESRLISLPPDT
jgi:hypothetical protein